MATDLKRPALVWALLLIIIWVSGYMVVPSVRHTEHHADHQAGTHSTGFCAWLCAGGVGIESSVVQFDSKPRLLERLSIPSFDIVLRVAPLSYFFRGPPRLLA